MSDKADGAAPLKDGQIGQRIPGKLKQRIKNIDRDFGIPEARLVEDALVAICDYVELNKGMRRPVKMVWDEEAAEQITLEAAEEQALYDAGRPRPKKR